MRGYGDSDKPKGVDRYSMNYLVGDLVGVVLALGESKAILVGHDWGAQIVWTAAMIRPDVFYAVCGMSVTFSGKVPMLPEGLTIMDLYKSAAGPDRQYYRVYFQQIGVAEKELEKDVRKSVLGLLYTLSGDIVSDRVQNACFDGFFPANSSILDSFVVPEKLPSWLTEKDLEFYIAEFKKSGFTGGLNYYRNINALSELFSPYQGRKLTQPSCYIAGSLDMVGMNTLEKISEMKENHMDLRECLLIEGAGHWIQQERVDQVNETLLRFLKSVKDDAEKQILSKF
jgi:pimeloyl-ACP methyl ester carboxylesterase